MDSFEWNKIFGALLAALLLIAAMREVSSLLFHHEQLEELASMREIASQAAAQQSSTPQKPAEEPIAKRLASADVARGEGIFARCAACHTANKGGADGIGPHLWNVVGRPIGSVSGFAYSDALAGKGGAWDYEALDGFLKNPGQWAPGTKMAFAGLARGSQRADVIAYLREQSDSPLPLPEVPAEEPAVEEVDGGDAPASETPAENTEESATQH